MIEPHDALRARIADATHRTSLAPLAALVLSLLSIAVVPGCRASAVARRPAPPELIQTEIAKAPWDVEQPMSQVVWVMRYDLREFDALWTWLTEEVPPSANRDRALGAAALLGISELDRHELIREGVEAFDRAAEAFPEDARLPLWRAYLQFLPFLRGGDAAGKAEAYDRLRTASRDYPEFTLFGLTLAVAADPDADQALVEEALEAYRFIIEETNHLQFAPDARSRSQALRVFADWHSAPYNLPGTLALRGDLAARAGDFELARESYYTALNTNFGYRWLWRDEVERKLADVEAVHERMKSGQEPMLGARHRDALGAESSFKPIQAEGRIGNGSCTLCHSGLDVSLFGRKTPPTGWIHVRAERPAGVATPIPVFVALPSADDDAIPVGFSVGAVSASGLPGYDAETELLDVWIPAPPGSWMVAGLIDRGPATVFSTYSKRLFGLPRFLEVREGEVTEAPQVLEWGPPR